MFISLLISPKSDICSGRVRNVVDVHNVSKPTVVRDILVQALYRPRFV